MNVEFCSKFKLSGNADYVAYITSAAPAERPRQLTASYSNHTNDYDWHSRSHMGAVVDNGHR